jgi:hypothetical protein
MRQTSTPIYPTISQRVQRGTNRPSGNKEAIKYNKTKVSSFKNKIPLDASVQV